MTFSVVIPTMGIHGLLDLALESLARTQSRDYELNVARDDGSLGMARTIELAVAKATGEWFILAHDDVVFLPGWDDFPPLSDDLMLRLEALDCKGLTWPPAVTAGDAPYNFQFDTASNEVGLRRQRRSQRIVAGGPLLDVVTLVHRSRWVPWPDWTGMKYRTHDVAWWLETHRRHPDLIFGWLPGNCVYHFVHGSVRHKAEPAEVLDGPSDTFDTRYGMSVPEASELIYSHSRRLYSQRRNEQ